MRKNSQARILKWETKEQYLSIVPKSCPCVIIVNKKKFDYILYVNKISYKNVNCWSNITLHLYIRNSCKILR